MKHYKNPQDEIFGFDDNQQHLVTADMIEITMEEVQVIITAKTPQPTPEEVQLHFEAEIQQRLDDFARTRNYSGIMSACTYATSTVPKFATEGQHCVNLRDATWAAAYQLLDEVLDGTRPMPNSIDDIESDLPVLAWPE